MNGRERQITFGNYNHKLAAKNLFTPDGRRVVYDTRTKGGGLSRIETVDLDTLEVRVVYENQRGAQACVPTCHPFLDRFVFIKGLDDPYINGAYCAHTRQGAIVDEDKPGVAEILDARDIYPPFTAGAMRGGSHVHAYSPDGAMISNTYEDAVLAANGQEHDGPRGEANLRNIEINVLGMPVAVKSAPGNFSGSSFSFLAARLVSEPAPGSDDISSAIEEGWIGRDGYITADGRRVKKAIACQGVTTDEKGRRFKEVYVIDLPEPLSLADTPEIKGSMTRRPLPPEGVVQRRLTRLGDRTHPGIAGPRHWLRSTPDGAYILFLAADDKGLIQIFRVPTIGGEPEQVTENPFPVTSQFDLSPDGQTLYYMADGSLFKTPLSSGGSERLTPRTDKPRSGPVCVSPDGRLVLTSSEAEEDSGFTQLFIYERD